jgi:uncharacterized tellurite resistance protein B-like protein
MGLFSNVKSQNAPVNYYPKNEQEAWIAVMYVCISTDGNVSDAEIDNLSRIVTFKSIFDDYNVAELYKKAAKAKEQGGEGQLLSKAAELITDETKFSLFACALDLVCADGSIEKKEQMMIEKVAEALKIDETTAKDYVDVIIAKNKFNKVFVNLDDDEDDDY